MSNMGYSQIGSGKPRSALADGAERLAQLARTVREQQIAEQPGAMRLAVTDVYSMSPDEAWSKRFMSQGIGPTPDCAAPGGYCPMPFVQTDLEPVSPATVQAAPVLEIREARLAAAPAQIGQAIGKPYRRSWLGLRRSP